MEQSYKLILLVGAIFWSSFCYSVELRVGSDGHPNVLEDIAVYSLESPIVEQTGVVQGANKVFKLSPGRYSVVRWGGGAWTSSPLWDYTVDVANNDIDLALPNQVQFTQISLSLGPKHAKAMRAYYRDFSFVPCRFQRINDGEAIPFGFRWGTLEWLDETTLQGSVAIGADEFSVTFPSLAATTPIGEKPKHRLEVPHAYCAFTFRFKKNGTVEAGEIDGLKISMASSKTSNLKKSAESKKGAARK